MNYKIIKFDFWNRALIDIVTLFVYSFGAFVGVYMSRANPTISSFALVCYIFFGCVVAMLGLNVLGRINQYYKLSRKEKTNENA